MTALSDAPARPDAEPSPRLSGWARAVFVGVCALAFVAGAVFFFVTRSALWLDEALTVNISRVPFGDLRERLLHDGAPPLYYAFLHVWTGVLGDGNLASRSLSGACMVGAVVAIWFVAVRFTGDQLAGYGAAALTAASPYAIRYATEARMYSTIIVLVTVGILAVQRSFDAPTLGRLAIVALVTAALVYTQYWSFYLLLTAVLLLGWIAWRGAGDMRRAARRILVAIAVGGVAFLPWVPTFLDQAAHTGTPWGEPILPGIPFGYTLRDFAGGASGTAADRQEGWILFFILVPLLLIGVFASEADARGIRLDLRIPAQTRAFAFMLLGGLAIALSLNYLAGGAFQSRYSAIVFPFFICLVARGLVYLRDTRVMAVVLAVTVLFGIAGGIRNVRTQRTQAGAVAAALRENAKPDDLVIYCPDQLGPSVHRLIAGRVREATYPRFGDPAFVDWVDYKARLQGIDVNTFARDALARAGNHTLWYVTAPGYTTHAGKCEALSDAFAKVRTRTQVTNSDEKIFEKPALQMFAPGANG